MRMYFVYFKKNTTPSWGHHDLSISLASEIGDHERKVFQTKNDERKFQIETLGKSFSELAQHQKKATYGLVPWTNIEEK